MPGEVSLRTRQYYAHPQNLFWKILGEILGYAPEAGKQGTGLRDATFPEKLRVLRASDIAVWDVLASCHRKGSLDSDIDHATVEANDFAGFFAGHRHIERVLFNGAKAESCFRKYVAPTLDMGAIQCIRLPSTSPANASIAYPSKLAAWREGLIG
jgi:double-stranded uracil-DNA glycosylase